MNINDTIAQALAQVGLDTQHGCLVLYPEQSAGANTSRCWNWFRPQDQVHEGGEPALIAAVGAHAGLPFAAAGSYTDNAGPDASAEMLRFSLAQVPRG